MTCLNYFYQLLGRRDYSVRELEKKGQQKGFEAEEVTAAIAHLQSLGYQSDTKLVQNLILSKGKKYGKAVLKRKCLEKGIPADVFEQIWEAETEGEELPQLVDLKSKVMRKYKIENWRSLDPKIKAKVVSYLKYRGFNPFEVLGQWQSQDEEEFQ